MVTISNEDFRVVKVLLGELQRLTGNDAKTANVKRNAKRLRAKFMRKTKD